MFSQRFVFLWLTLNLFNDVSLLFHFLSWRWYEILSSFCMNIFSGLSSHAPISNPFHGRLLDNNAITSIPSGAFTGLSALYNLWGRGILWLCGDRFCYLVIYNPLIVWKSVFQISMFAVVYFLVNCSNLMEWCFALVSFHSRSYKTCLSSGHFILFTLYFLSSLTHWSLNLSMADISIPMQSPASTAAPSPAWPRWILCEGGGCCDFVWIDCII